MMIPKVSGVSGNVFQAKMDTVFGKLDGLSGIAVDTLLSMARVKWNMISTYSMSLTQHGITYGSTQTSSSLK